MCDGDGFVDALLAAPGGVALIGMLEARARPDGRWWQVPTYPDPEVVAAAVDAVRSMSFGSLLATAVDALAFRAGPWMPSAVDDLAAAYEHAEARRPIAEAIDECFGTELHRGFDGRVQEWWTSHEPGAEHRVPPGFQALDHVYGAGQFAISGLWTVTRPPPEVHLDLCGAWELETGPVSRWHLPVRPPARVAEIHRPEDWVALVTAYPRVGRDDESWELPGHNQRPDTLTGLLTVPGQRAARTAMRRHLVPDWTSVAADFDGVHLSWSGFLTSEGCISDLGDGDVAMLRYWFSERTHWLRDVFGDPDPLAPPWLDLEPGNNSFPAADPRADGKRRQRDRFILNARLGR